MVRIWYCSTARAWTCRRLRSRHHPQVVGRGREVGPGRHGRAALTQVVGGGHDRRHHRAQPQRLGPELGPVQVERRTPPELGAEKRHGAAQDLEGRALLRHVRQHPRQAGGQGAQLRHLAREPARLVLVGELSLEQQVPDVLERSARRQVDGGVLAVMEEPFLPPHITQGGLRRHHTLEPGGDLGAVLVRGAQTGHPHEVAQRHHADELVTVDDGEVPVLMMRQAGPGRVHLLLGPEHVGVGRHPHLHRLGARRGGRGGGPQQVALGQDAGDLAPFGHDDRADPGVADGVGRVGQRRPGFAGHGRGRHEITDDGRHGHGPLPAGFPPGVGARRRGGPPPSCSSGERV